MRNRGRDITDCPNQLSESQYVFQEESNELADVTDVFSHYPDDLPFLNKEIDKWR